MYSVRVFGGRLRGAQFLLDDGSAQHIEAFLNQARLVLIGCLLVLANRGMLPGSTSALILAVAAGGLAWFLVVGLLIKHLYRPWVAIAIAMVDVFFVSALVYLTGGPTSPLDTLYPIVVFAAIVRFTRLHSILFTGATIVVYAALVTSHPAYSPVIHGQVVLTRGVILAATGVLAWLIAAEVARQRTAVVEAQQQLDSLTTISHIAQTLDSQQTADGIMSAAIEMIEPLVGPRGAVGALMQEYGELRVVAAVGSCGPADCAVGLDTERIAALAETQTRESIVAAIKAEGCPEVLEVPVVSGGVTLGWQCVGHSTAHTLSPADRALLQRLAEETGAALRRVQLLERERERSRSLALLADENGRLLDNERQTVSRLRQLASHKDSFIDMVAHELRTPLTSIKGFAQMMQRGAIEGTSGSRYTTFILAESNRLMAIIDDIVDLSRMERGLLEMDWASIDLTPMLRDLAVGENAGRGRTAVDVEPNLPPVRGDADKLRQSFAYLLETGARYHRGAAPMTLAAVAHGDQVFVQLQVEGDVPELPLAQVFEHMPTEPHEPTRSTLGLYICRNFVEAHSGRLWLEHAEGRGRFTIQLPTDPNPAVDEDRAALPLAEPALKPSRGARLGHAVHNRRR